MVPAKVIIDPQIFRRSDIRGIYPSQINLKIAKVIGRSFHDWLKAKSNKQVTIAIGRDVRVSSGEIFTGLAEGIMAAGGNIIDLDLIGTEVISFAAATLDVDGAAIVSASHNPKEFNGIKFVKRGAVPVAFDSGLEEIKSLTKLALSKTKPTKGHVSRVDILQTWSEFMKNFIDHTKIKPYVVVLDAGNGMAGIMLDKLLPLLPIKTTKMYFEPDGNFPNHIPNPMIEQNLQDLVAEVKRQKADLGIAFDGDADRAIFVGENGVPLNCSVVGALVARDELKKNPKSTVLYNAVCGKILPETVSNEGGNPIRTMVGHSVIKEKMRSMNAIFAAEHSGHFYYRDYFSSDSSMLTVIKVLEILTQRNLPTSELVKPLNVYPQSGEINFETSEKDQISSAIQKQYIPNSTGIDRLDGLSLWFDSWWFNLRPSQNEDLLRLNVEATTKEQLDRQTSHLTSHILNLGAKIAIIP